MKTGNDIQIELNHKLYETILFMCKLDLETFGYIKQNTKANFKKQGFKIPKNIRTHILRFKLLNHIAQLNTTPNKIKERQTKNPFPIGTRSVYVFACGGEISDSAKWKLLQFFESLK